jgi:hypothetical protein
MFRNETTVKTIFEEIHRIARGATLLQKKVAFIPFQHRNELGYDILVFFTVNCGPEYYENNSASARQRTPFTILCGRKDLYVKRVNF